MTEHAVVIAGGGPTGLMLAAELAGVDVAIVERRASQDLTGSRAGGLCSRTIEVLDQRGILRVRRRTQSDPQGGWHRVPGVGSDDELPDRRGRDGRGAGMGHPLR